MSEEILKVFLADLRTVRVTCQKCKTTVECDIEGIGQRLSRNMCPICSNDFTFGPTTGPNDYNPFRALAELFKHLEAVKNQAKVEFPVKVTQ